MNNKEAIAELKAMPINYPLTNGEDRASRLMQARDIAVEALEHPEKNVVTIVPCGDAISRQAVLDIIRFEDKWLLDAKNHNADTEIAFSGMKSKVSDLPSVNPQNCDKCEVGNPCIYCKHEFESQESEDEQ